MNELFQNAPQIIREAARSPLGLMALMVLAMAVLGYFFFRRASERTRTVVYILLFVGVVSFGYAMFSVMPPVTQSEPVQAVEKEGRVLSQVATLRVESLLQRTRNVQSLLKDIAAGQVGTASPLNRVNDLNNSLVELWTKIAGYGLGSEPFLDNIFVSRSGFVHPEPSPDFGFDSRYIHVGIPRLHSQFLEFSRVSVDEQQVRQINFEELVTPYSNPAVYPHKDFNERAYNDYRHGRLISSPQYSTDLRRLGNWLADLEGVLLEVKGRFRVEE